MLVVVCLKAATRTDIPLRLESRGSSVHLEEALPEAATRSLFPLHTALGLKKTAPAAKILAVSVGPPSCERLLREALALGADEVLRIWPERAVSGAAVDGSTQTTHLMAGAAAEVLRPRGPALTLCTDTSGDTGHECFGAFLADALGAAFAHRAVTLEPVAGTWRVAVKIERGYTQEMALQSPAVVTLAGRLENMPDPSLPAWLESLSAPLPVVECAPFTTPRATTTLRPPVPRVKRYGVPDGGLDAEGRIRTMVSQPAGGGGTVLGPEVPPEEQAAQAARLLREGGYL